MIYPSSVGMYVEVLLTLFTLGSVNLLTIGGGGICPVSEGSLNIENHESLTQGPVDVPGTSWKSRPRQSFAAISRNLSIL